MIKKLQIIAFILTIFSVQRAYSQAYTYFPFNSVFSISSNTNKVLWMDFRLQMNSYFTSLGTEIAPMINYKTIGKAKLYAGGGARFNFLNYLNDDASKRKPFEAYFLSFGTRISPLKKATGVQVVFELSPDISKAIDVGQMRARLGVGYLFEKKKK